MARRAKESGGTAVERNAPHQDDTTARIKLLCCAAATTRRHVIAIQYGTWTRQLGAGAVVRGWGVSGTRFSVEAPEGKGRRTETLLDISFLCECELSSGGGETVDVWMEIYANVETSKEEMSWNLT